MALNEKKAGKISLDEQASRDTILEGAKELYDNVVTTYGPKGRNVSIVKSYGFPMITRDGVTVARETYFSREDKNQGAQYLYQASEVTNRVAGDGTSATVAVAYHALAGGALKIAAGVHPMALKDTLYADVELLLKELKFLSKPVKKGQLQQVATVSSGDPLLGQLIAEAVEHVGPDGGIVTERGVGSSVERDYVDGYYLQPGFAALPQGRKEQADPNVVVVGKRITSHADMITLLTKVAELTGMQQGQILSVLFIGNIEEQAYNSLIALVNQGQVDAIVVKPPLSYGDMGARLLEDIAIYAGCEPISDTTNIRDLSADHIGHGLSRVVATKNDATLYGIGESETVQDRIAQIKGQIETEQVDAIRERLKDRVAKLDGKIAIFRIGGSTDTAKEEVEFRVQDAILATRAAEREGIVSGGGTTLLELSKTKGLSELSRDTLRSTFKQLLINAALPEQLKLQEALDAKYGWGFNLRKGDELVDLTAEGVLDPTLVVEQVIQNGLTQAAELLSIGRSIINETKDE
jgi:chaperonin GroEL